MTKRKPGAKRGRPPIEGDTMRKVTLFLTEELYAKAQAISGGNASEGVRMAIAKYRIRQDKLSSE
jgi:hypothetical protein